LPSEDALREKLATASRILALKGLVGLYGHVSAYDPETDRVYLTPGAGSDRANVKPEDLWVFNSAGEKLSGEGRLALEWPIHTCIHAAHKDALAVAHLHAPFSTLFAIAEREFRPVTINGAMFAQGLGWYDYLGLVTTLEEGRRMASALGPGQRGVLMRGHGSAVVGRTVEEMLHACLILEDNAMKIWMASSLGPIRSLSVEDCQTIIGRGVPSTDAPWMFLTRQDSVWDHQPAGGWHPLE